MTSMILLSLIFSTSIVSDDEADALAKARTFRELAASANGMLSNHYVPVFELKETDHTTESYDFIFADGGVIVRRSDHLIVGFSFSPPDKARPRDEWDEFNAIGDTTAQALAAQYIEASGLSQPCVVKAFTRDLNSSFSTAYIMTVAPTYNSIPYHPTYGIFVEVEYNTGRLLGFSRDAELPHPPPTFQTSVTLENALFNFATHVFNTYGVSNINMETSELVIWNPKPTHINYQSNNMPQSVLDLIGTNDSVLVYCFWAVQPSGYAEGKRDISGYSGYVDPNSGAVWSVKQYFPFGGGKATPLQWDLGIGAITVSNAKQSIEVKDADVDRISAPKKFTPSSKIVLRRAKVVVVIEYDRSSGLIRTTLGEAHSYGKPSADLKKALDRLTR